jgi:hypothetical protein
MVVQYCKKMCQPVQTVLGTAIPGIPEDTVWGCVQNAIYSFTVSIILTNRNYIAGTKSALLAAVATIVYAFITALFAQFLNRYFSIYSNEKPDLTKTPESFFIASAVTYLVSEMGGAKMEIVPSLLATGLPYAIKNPSMQTPLFGTIIG